MAERIRLSRAKGWRMPENTVSVARPNRWGNPYRVAPAFESHGVKIPEITAQAAVELFRERITATVKQWASARAELEKLRGKNLACWCPLTDKDGSPVPCHADVLLDLANRP